MAVHTTPPDGWHRTRATHRDRKYSSATPVVYEHDDSGRRVEIVPTLVRAPGDGQEWQVRELFDGTSLVLDSADEREAAIAIAVEAMQGH
jgi:hypothetical protein